MELPSHYLKRPAGDLSPEVVDSFDRLFAERILSANGGLVDYKLSAPKWQFLNYLGDAKDVLLHGSGSSAISEFQPRQSNDVKQFGDQRAIYAASDGIWASYFAIVDRDRYVRSLVNACVRVAGADGQFVPHYYFSINDDALPHQPWRTGTMYVLPRSSFEHEVTQKANAESAQWRSFVPVKPLAKITIDPTDFPFLDQIHGHDFATVSERAAEDPDGFPWLDD